MTLERRIEDAVSQLGQRTLDDLTHEQQLRVASQLGLSVPDLHRAWQHERNSLKTTRDDPNSVQRRSNHVQQALAEVNLRIQRGEYTPNREDPYMVELAAEEDVWAAVREVETRVGLITDGSRARRCERILDHHRNCRELWHGGRTTAARFDRLTFLCQPLFDAIDAHHERVRESIAAEEWLGAQARAVLAASKRG